MSCVSWCDFVGDIPDKTDPESLLCEWSISLSTLSYWAIDNFFKAFELDTPTVPTQFYVAIHSTVSSGVEAGTELSGDNYARVPITFEKVSDIQRWNAADVIFPLATAEWPTVASFTIWDNASGGNYWAYGNLQTEISIDSGKTVKFPENKVIIGAGV